MLALACAVTEHDQALVGIRLERSLVYTPVYARDRACTTGRDSAFGMRENPVETVVRTPAMRGQDMDSPLVDCSNRAWWPHIRPPPATALCLRRPDYVWSSSTYRRAHVPSTYPRQMPNDYSILKISSAIHHDCSARPVLQTRTNTQPPLKVCTNHR